MITVYKKGTVPKTKELISINDIYFNQTTVMLLDNRAADIIDRIDGSVMTGQFTIRSRFDGMTLNIDKLSTGCKTALNILYNPQKVFDIRECGDNVLDLIYALPEGTIYCDYPLISFDMHAVYVCEKNAVREIGSYEELKEWWQDED